MITFNVETVDECLEEIKPLLYAHWEEIAWYKDQVKLNPDYDVYYKLEEQGVLHIVTARDNDVLIGYYISFVHPNPHYKNTLFAVNDILFVHPDYRGGSTAYRMFKYAFAALKELGAVIITIHMKTDAPFEALCEALGMEKQEYLFTIYLGD